MTLDPKIRATLNAVALEVPEDVHWSDLVDAVMCATNVPDDQIPFLDTAAKEIL